MATIKSYTNLEQSKKLAEILPLESADNVIVSFGSREGTKTVVMPKETLDVFRTPFADIRETTMCWSLAALLSLIPEVSLNTFKDGKWNAMMQSDGKMIYTDKDNPIDTCYELIIHLNELNLL